MKKNILKFKNSIWSSSYNLSNFRSDILSAGSVALLALPQSLAYALMVGLPLHSGILAAIFGTLLTASFGHSKHLISGPTNATALMIQAGTSQVLYHHFYDVPDEFKGILVLQIISQIVLCAGVIQLIIASLKLGGFTQFISRSVMMGYILGVSISIWVGQLFTLFSIEKPQGKFSCISQIPYLFKNLPQLNPLTTLLGLSSLLLLITLKKVNRTLPRSLITLIFSGLIAYFVKSYLPVESPWAISRLSSPDFDIRDLFNFPLAYQDKAILQDILFISFALALLSIFEVNSISRLISAKSGQSIKNNRDIMGVGISNIVSSFFLGTLPSSGSPSRSIFNYHNGATSKTAAIACGLFIIALLSLLYPLMQFIPVVSLAAILIMIGYEIIDFKLLKICLRATKRDALVLVVTCFSCLFFTLDIALFIGIALSLILYLRLAAQTDILEYVFTSKGHFKPMNKNRERPENRIRILNMDGNLFFGSIDNLQRKLHKVLSDEEVQILILRFNNVQHLDASICYFLEMFASNLKKQGKSIYLCEMHATSLQVVHESPLLKKLGNEYLYETDPSSPIKATEKAFAHALNQLNKQKSSSSNEVQGNISN